MCYSQKGILAGSTNWLVEENEVERLFDYGVGDCDYSRFSGDKGTFRKNYYHGTKVAEKGSAHVDCFQCFDDNGTFSNNITIEGNRGFHFAEAFMGEATVYKKSSNIVFKNNVFCARTADNPDWTGGSWGLCVKDISNVTAVNNVFANINTYGVGLDAGCTNAVVKNNIFYNCGDSYSFGASSAGDYNLMYNTDAPAIKGSHDIVGVDPMFVNFNSLDFHLQTGSPCIDAGDPTFTAPSCGGIRIDIGAYEYGCVDDPDDDVKPPVITGSGSEERILVYPNPVRISKGGSAKLANLSLNSTIKIYSLDGKLITTISAGTNRGKTNYYGGSLASWDGTNDNNDVISSGIYYCISQDGNGAIRKGKLAILK